MPWLLAGHAGEVNTTLSQVRASLPRYPHHPRPRSPPMRTEWTSRSIYLSNLLSEVGGAKTQGLTVEQTVARVTLPSFQGYKIWDWVHKQVNVPSTYAELAR